MMKRGKWSSACPRRATFNSKNVKRGIAGVRAAGMKILADRRRWSKVSREAWQEVTTNVHERSSLLTDY